MGFFYESEQEKQEKAAAETAAKAAERARRVETVRARNASQHQLVEDTRKANLKEPYDRFMTKHKNDDKPVASLKDRDAAAFFKREFVSVVPFNPDPNTYSDSSEPSAEPK